MNTQRPNIIIITTDQQRTDSLSCYGSTFTDTPHLDKLASEGVWNVHIVPILYVHLPAPQFLRVSM